MCFEARQLRGQSPCGIVWGRVFGAMRRVDDGGGSALPGHGRIVARGCARFPWRAELQPALWIQDRR